MRRNENSQHQRNQVVVVMHKPHEVGYVHAGRVSRYTPEATTLIMKVLYVYIVPCVDVIVCLC